MQLIKDLNWRYATKKYDHTKKVSDQDLTAIKEVIRLTATSYGLQLFKVLHIKNPEVRATLLPHSWGQPQITEASDLFVFCHYDNVTHTDIDNYLELKAKLQEIPLENLESYGSFVKKGIDKLSQDEKEIWNHKQTYIALGKALVACAELGIDSTPIEGFAANKYEEILELKSKNLKASVVLAIGYRSDEDQTQHQAKVRKSLKEIVEEI